MVTDGPFTESKEQLLGFYVIDCADRDAAARDPRGATHGCAYLSAFSDIPQRLFR